LGDIILTDAGAGYPINTANNVTVIRGDGDTETTDADIKANSDGAGIITSFTVLDGGLYSVIPTLVISGGTATAYLNIPCVRSTTVYIGDCESSPQTSTAIDFSLGQCSNFCLPSSYPYLYNDSNLTGLLSDVSTATQGCCDCTNCGTYDVVIVSELSTVVICYTHCKTGISDALIICSDSPETPIGTASVICAVPGSIYCSTDINAIVSITRVDDCSEC
jgi:hypothetical protein